MSSAQYKMLHAREDTRARTITETAGSAGVLTARSPIGVPAPFKLIVRRAAEIEANERPAERES